MKYVIFIGLLLFPFWGYYTILYRLKYRGKMSFEMFLHRNLNEPFDLLMLIYHYALFVVAFVWMVYIGGNLIDKII